jgi:hypothetical protein
MPHLHAAHERTSFSCGAKGSPACVCSIFLLLKFNFLRHELATLKVSRWEYSLKHTHMQPSRLVYSMYTCTYQQRVNPPPPLTPHRHLHQQRCRNSSAANHLGHRSAPAATDTARGRSARNASQSKDWLGQLSSHLYVNDILTQFLFAAPHRDVIHNHDDSRHRTPSISISLCLTHSHLQGMLHSSLQLLLLPSASPRPSRAYALVWHRLRAHTKRQKRIKNIQQPVFADGHPLNY